MSDNVSYELQQIRQILERIASATPVTPDVNVTVEGGSGGVSDGDKGALTVAGDVWTMNSVANPSWLTALDWAKLTGVPSTFAPSSHTHPLSALTTSGASTNDVATFNGTAWVPAAPAGGGIGGALGGVDNTLSRTNGTGGATLQGSSVVLDDSGNLAHTNWLLGSGVYSSRNYARLGANAANAALVLGVTGTGFISAAVPDGLAAGGNNRGNYAVDLCMQRGVAGHIASGAGAASIAGNASTVSGLEAFCGAGRYNNFTGDQAFGGGNSNTVSGAQGSTPGGFGNTASGARSIALGSGGQATLWAQIAHSGSTGTNSQRAELHAYRATSDATPSNLFLDGSSARVVVPANSSGVAMITVVARTNTATDQHMTWRRRVNWKRGIAVGTVSIDVETVGTDRGYTGGTWGAGPVWTLAITADITNGAINIIGMGTVATNIRWGASIEWIETTFA